MTQNDLEQSIEVLRSRIDTENDAISDLQHEVAAICWEAYKTGIRYGPAANEVFEQMRVKYDSIAALNSEISDLTRKASNAITCQQCGTLNPPDTKFCTYCGNRHEVAVADKELCPDCGSECKPTMKFCPDCGKNLESLRAAPLTEPKQKFCPNCVAEIDGDTNFCVNCGHNLSAISI